MSTYYIAKNGESEPITEEQIKAQLSTGQLAPTDLICQSGWPEWLAITKVFPPAYPPPPPIPVSSAAVIAPPFPQIDLSIPDRAHAQSIKTKAESLLTKEEFVIAVAAQTLSPLSPDGVVLTNRRVLIIVPKLGGLKLSFIDWLWSSIVNIHITEGLFGTTLSVQSNNRPLAIIERLEKDEARALYRIAQQMEELSIIGRHHLHMAELRAGSALLRK